MAELAAVGEDAPRTAEAIGGALPADITTLASASPADVHLTLTLKTIIRIIRMDQRALQVLSIYRWHCIKGLTKPYGHFTVLEV